MDQIYGLFSWGPDVSDYSDPCFEETFWFVSYSKAALMSEVDDDDPVVASLDKSEWLIINRVEHWEIRAIDILNDMKDNKEG